MNFDLADIYAQAPAMFLWFEKFSRVISYYFIGANLIYIFIEVCGFLNSKKKYAYRYWEVDEKLVSLKSLPPVSVLVPCYNEEKSICGSINSILNLNYPHFEVIVSNDGSKDRSIEMLAAEFDLFELTSLPQRLIPCEQIKHVYASRKHENLFVLDKNNGGKADALNAGINFANFPLICCVDSDSILDASGIIKVAIPFFEDPDRTIASGGTIALFDPSEKIDPHAKKSFRVPGSYLGMVQSIEYLRAFLIGRMGWDYLNMTTIISGAFGLFKKSVVIEVGGYARDTIGEDMDLVMRMHELYRSTGRDYRIEFLPDPVCWTEAPSDLGSLARQRMRWTQGLMESLWSSRGMFCKPWSGGIGWGVMVYLLLFEALSAPIELAGYLFIIFGLFLGVMSPEIVGLFLCATILFGVILNLGAIIIDQVTFGRFIRTSDMLRLVFGSFFEQIGFRQLHTVWRCIGIWQWLRGKKSWGRMVRKGINA